jgi:hypothetical protein
MASSFINKRLWGGRFSRILPGKQAPSRRVLLPADRRPRISHSRDNPPARNRKKVTSSTDGLLPVVTGVTAEDVEIAMTRIESDGKDIFVVHNGIRIAKRRSPNEPWEPLEPNYEVASDLIDIIVTRNGERVR